MKARLRLWWRALVRRRAFERELDAEFAFHLHARSDDLVAQGFEPAAARRLARIELGMSELQRDECRRARGLTFIDNLARDLRYAVRGLVRNPGYAATALGVLGVAIAANALLFALFNAYGLRTPPIAAPARWVSLEAADAEQSTLALWSLAEADALVAEPPPGFAGVYAMREIRLPVTAGGARSVSGEAVSGNYFELLGVAAARGRVYAADQGESELGTVVLSDLGWRRLLDADPAALGRVIEIAARPFTVIGITPPEFTGTTPLNALYWLRDQDYRRLRPDEVDDSLQLELGGFLVAGATAMQAAAALEARAREFNPRRDPELQVARARVEHRSGYLRASDLRDILRACLPIALAFALVLLVAAANLANLVLARFAARQRELAVRVSVGAPRSRLLVQLMTECMLLALVAAALGLALARALVLPMQGALFGLMGEFGYDLVEIVIDARVIAYGASLALFAALAFGGLPALLQTRPWRGGSAAQPDMRALQRGGDSRLRAGLMVAQLAVSVVLLVLASLIAGNARIVERTELGFDPLRTVAVHVERPTQALIDALAALPQVERVALASRTPLMGTPHRAAALVEGRTETLFVRAVDAAYLEVFGLELLRGRVLRAGDESGTAVAVISRRTAQRLWPGHDPVGRVFDLPPQDELGTLRAGRVEVVGVVEDVVSAWFVKGLDASAVYLPAAIGSPAIRSLVLRTRDTSAATLDAITRACVRAEPAQNCQLMPMLGAVKVQRLPFLIASRVAAALGWTALGISCIGLYGLVSYLLVQKRREIGVRLALGAQTGRVTREMLRGAARQVALGLAIGWPLAFAMSRIAASFTDQLRTFDLLSFGAVPIALAGLALLAAWLPARRTARVSPTEALRDD